MPIASVASSSGVKGDDDPSSVLDQYIHDISNLPGEISHLIEEINAKDEKIHGYKIFINQRDSTLQKFIKSSGYVNKYAKEETYMKTILHSYDQAQILQEEKIMYSEKAIALLDQHVKRLDRNIDRLQMESLMPQDFQLPSLLHASPGNLAPISYETMWPEFPDTNKSVISSACIPWIVQNRLGQRRQNSLREDPSGLTSFNNSPGLSVGLGQDEKTTLGNVERDIKPTNGLTSKKSVKKYEVKSNTSPIRQISLQPQGSTYCTNSKHEKDLNHAKDNSINHEEEGDDTKYCICQNVSYGDMVACDNSACKYQWFHWACIGIDKEPVGDWLCPECLKLSPEKVKRT